MIEEPRPRFLETLAAGDLFGAVAREVIEFYGDQVEAHPVGTGPFRLAQWRRSSFIALRAQSRFPRDVLRRRACAPTTPRARRCWRASRAAGCRWSTGSRSRSSRRSSRAGLSFVNGEADVAYRVGYQFVPQAMPERQGRAAISPSAASAAIRSSRPPAVLPVQHGRSGRSAATAPAQVALRRAIGLGMDSRKIIAYAYNGLGTVAQGPTAAEHQRLRPEAEDRVRRLRPGARHGAARPLRLSRPRRRRLARAPGRLAAGAARELGHQPARYRKIARC